MFVVENSKKKALKLFACYAVSYVALAVLMTFLTIAQTVQIGAFSIATSVTVRQLFATGLLVVYFIPLALRTKYHAKNGNVKWLYCTTKFLLILMAGVAAGNMIDLII